MTYENFQWSVFNFLLNNPITNKDTLGFLNNFMINNKNVEEKIVDSFTKIMWSEEYKDLKFLKFVILFEYIGIFISFLKFIN